MLSSTIVSPEIIKGKYDKSCDIWSLGIIVYILLCGYPPFNGTDNQIYEAILKGKFKFTGLQWSTKSDEARDFVKCLLTDGRKRLTAKEALGHPWIVSK